MNQREVQYSKLTHFMLKHRALRYPSSRQSTSVAPRNASVDDLQYLMLTDTSCNEEADLEINECFEEDLGLLLRWRPESDAKLMTRRCVHLSPQGINRGRRRRGPREIASRATNSARFGFWSIRGDPTWKKSP